MHSKQDRNMQFTMNRKKIMSYIDQQPQIVLSLILGGVCPMTHVDVYL